MRRFICNPYNGGCGFVATFAIDAGQVFFTGLALQVIAKSSLVACPVCGHEGWVPVPEL